MIKNIFSKITLDNGRQMYGYGFGVYKAGGQELLDALREAFACGYRYIDTASFYHNEKEVGEAIKKSGIPRDQLYIVSKIWPTEFKDPLAALERSLENLGLDYLDTYLLHWPGLDKTLRLKTWEALSRQCETGKILTLGVSNFLQVHLEELWENFHVWAPVNQIEIHPVYQQKELCAFCAGHKIQVISWSPLGRGHDLKLPAILSMAASLGRTPAQVILRWQIQRNLVPIPKSLHASRIRENAAVFDFELNEEQMREIGRLDLPDAKGRTGKDPMLWPPME